jgi:hypothetical protein
MNEHHLMHEPDHYVVIMDFRQFEIRGRRDMAKIYERAITDLRDDCGDKLSVEFVCIHEDQNKQLRLERYEQTGDAAEAKTFRIERFRNHDVVIYDRYDGMPCPGCRKLH